jgi:hypothetical protein
MVVCPGCSSSEGGGGGAGGDGGGDGSNAVSFDGETSVPATGGAAIAVDYSTGFARVISSMLSALAIDAASETDSASLKFLDNVELPICDNAGGAILNGELAEGTASLTLTNCTGSPLSGTAVNGRLLLTFDWTPATVPGTTNLLHSLEGTAELAGLTDAEGDVFTIAPSTELTGRSAMNAEVVTTATLPPQAISAQITLGQLASDDRITVVEGAGAGARMEFTCFEVSMDLMVDPPPPSIANFEAQGVLSLEGQYYTLSSDDIGFPALSGGPAAPTSGSLTLTSGESGTCVAGAHPGDGSAATATFAEGGSVTIDATGADGATYRCTEAWANLLEALTDLTAFESCPCVTGCGGGGGDGDVITCAADALSDFNAYLDPLIEVLKAVEDTSYTIPPEKQIVLNWDTGVETDYGEFSTDLDVNLDGKSESHLSGTVRPKDTCRNGMLKDEVCVFKWNVTREPSSTEVAYGAMSAVALGVSLPLNTTSTRYTIVSYGEPDVGKVNIAIGISPDCAIEVDTFTMMWHLRIPDMYSLQMGLDAEYRDDTGWNTARGDVIWGSGGSEDATISFTTDSETLQCGFDVETFEVSSCEP